PPRRRISGFNRRLLAYALAALLVFACLTVLNLSQLPASVANDASLVAKHDRESHSLGQSAHIAWRLQSNRLYEHRGHEGLPDFRPANSDQELRIRDLLDAGWPPAELYATTTNSSNFNKGFALEAGLHDSYVAMSSFAANNKERRLLPSNASQRILSQLERLTGQAAVSLVSEFPAGSQMKLLLQLDAGTGGASVVFKPRVYDRDRVMTGSVVAGRDRDNAEVVGYHLGRLLGFHRGPVASPRLLNLTAASLAATPRLRETFYRRLSDNRLCLWGVCRYCTGRRTGVCAGPDEVLEGVAVLMLPHRLALKRHRHPWARNYASNDAKAAWQLGENPCNSQLLSRLGPGVLLDLIDTSILDFLLGNADRHEFETAAGIGGQQLVVTLDNGKGLGNPYHDELSILAPLQQCCRLRTSTNSRLLALQGLLGAATQAALCRSGASSLPSSGPLLTLEHSAALDRRLDRVLRELDKCNRRLGPAAVLVSDDARLTL
uniref:Fam20C domain-containing protein n=1 Tax=Macrostomum lignano TaxID=282301 RepID=A0A1I8HKK1_9PLAT